MNIFLTFIIFWGVVILFLLYKDYKEEKTIVNHYCLKCFKEFKLNELERGVYCMYCNKSK